MTDNDAVNRRAVRRYVFRGRLCCLIQKTPIGESSVRQQYLAMGSLLYLGRRSDGTSLEVALADEPDDDNYVYPVAGDLRANAVGGDGDEDNDDEEAAEEGDNDNPNRTYSAKQTNMIVLRDNDKLPLPHVGMFVSLVLRRGGLLQRELLLDAHGAPVTSALDETVDETLYYQYEYAVERVKTWRAALNVTQQLLREAVVRPTHALASVQQRAAHDRHMESNKFRVNSASVELQRKRKASITVFACPNDGWLADIRAIAHHAIARTDTLASLMRVGDKTPDLAAQLWPAFRNLYALSHDLLTADGGQPIELPPYQKCVQQLRIGGRLLNQSSVAEVRCLDRWLADNEVHVVPFFGAFSLPIKAQTLPLLRQWPGFEWNPLRDRAVTKHAVKAIQPQLLRPQSIEPEACFELAYRLHREQQRPWRRDRAIIDVGELVRSLNRFWYRDAQLEQPVVDEAINFLQSIGAWRPVPESTQLRLLLHTATTTNGGGDNAWFCTEREYDLVASLTNVVLLMSSRLRLCVVPYTGALPSLVHDEPLTVVLYAGAQPLRKAVGKRVPRVAVSSLLADFVRYRSSEPCVAELLAYRRIVVVDAHLLARQQLDQLLRILWSTGAPVVLAGDSALESSEFAMLLDSQQLVVVEDTPASSNKDDDDKDGLRAAAHRSIRGGGCALQQLVGAMAPVAERSVNATWRDRPTDRFVLVAPYRREQQALLANMAATAADDKLKSVLAELAAEPDLVQHTVLTAAPFVGYNGAACRIVGAFTLTGAPHRLERIERRDTLPVPLVGKSVRPALSLDAPDLLLQLYSADFDGVDHRQCCHTWDANVMLVACHRAELVGQSISTSDSVCPSAYSASAANACITLCFGQSYRLDDVHRALSVGVHATETLTALNLDMELFVGNCAQRYPHHTRSLLPDMLAK